jgi:hypothetical protein
MSIIDIALAYKLPLVEGSLPELRGSISEAMRNARPKALNTVSHW